MQADIEAEGLRPQLVRVLSRFAGRSLDDALIAEMTNALNEQLAPWREGRSIHIRRGEGKISVELQPEAGAYEVSEPYARAEVIGDPPF